MAASNPVCHPDVRVVRHEGAIWLDLARDDGTLVRVTDKGWSLVEQTDVPLIWSDGMQPLPIPKSDPHALLHLRRLLNLSCEDHLMLVVAFLLAALWPEGPYPLLAFDGEQGTGKSTMAMNCRRLVDPNVADLRAPPGSQRDFLIAAQTSRLVAFDNVSAISPELADALCRLSTGGGLSTRELYTTWGESCLSAWRPVLLNGIPQLVTRSDLADRAIVITLSPIPDHARRPLSEIRQAFESAAPGILALLLDGIVEALRRLPDLKVSRLPRMADFAKVACAAASAFGRSQEDMLGAFERNKAEAADVVLEAEPLAWAILRIARGHLPGAWIGTATSLQILERQHDNRKSWRLERPRVLLRDTLWRRVGLGDRYRSR
jgi:hypothetical protein